MERFLQKRDILERLKIHTNTLDRWVKQGKFPLPVCLGGRVRFWSETDVDAWLKQQKAIQQAGPVS